MTFQVYQVVCISMLLASCGAQYFPNYEPNPSYAFNYNVNDPVTGDAKSHVETRQGDVVQGEYSLIEPDGSLRNVQYSSAPGVGFNAVVSKTPGVAPPNDNLLRGYPGGYPIPYPGAYAPVAPFY